MRSPTRAFALLLFALPFSAMAATPLEIWPAGNVAPQEVEAGGLPRTLQPAVRFQKVFLKILAGEKPGGWQADMESFCNQPAQTPLAAGLCEVARVWIARAQMEEIDALLHGYYRRNIRFPGTLAELGQLPQSLKKDPWDGSWSYSLLAPKGFSRLAGQRYQLGPARFPKLTTLSEAVRERAPQPHAWVVTPRDVAGSTALEFRGTKSTAVIQPGGGIDGCVLLFIGNKWALLAGVDQLFAIGF